MGLSEGSWKERATQSPLTNVDPPLGVGIGMNRKPESFNKDLVDVKRHQKKKKVAEVNNVARATEVAGQPCRDQ